MKIATKNRSFGDGVFFEYGRESGLKTILLHTAPYRIAPRICGSVVNYKCEILNHVLMRTVRGALTTANAAWKLMGPHKMVVLRVGDNMVSVLMKQN